MKTSEFKELVDYFRADLKLDLSKENEKQLYDKFVNTKNCNDVILWRCVCVTNERHPDAYKRQGTITKKNFELINKSNIDPNKDICFGDIAKYVSLYCYFKDIEFTNNKEKILDFYNGEEENYPLLDYLE